MALSARPRALSRTRRTTRMLSCQQQAEFQPVACPLAVFLPEEFQPLAVACLPVVFPLVVFLLAACQREACL